jgi:hypothetical protein
MAKNTKNEATYILDSKKGLPNKLLQADGSITDMLGNVVVNGDKSWEAKQALPNKFLNPDGTYSTLNEILSGAIDTDIFVVVDELPATGDEQKIYLVPDGKGGFVEYHWTGSSWDAVGSLDIDLSNYSTTQEMMNAIEAAALLTLNNAKDYANALVSNIPPQIIYYDGSKTNYAFWNDLIKITTPVLIYMFQEYNRAVYSAYIVNPSLIPESSNNRTIRFIASADYIRDTGGGYTYYSQQVWVYKITFTNGEATSIYTSYEQTQLNAIDPTKTYLSPFNPTQPYHPSTKKYVDDSIASNITTVLQGSY